jgi:DNA-binding protein HU-beta
MARVLGVSEGYLLGTTDSPEPDVYIANAKFKALPVIGEIACGNPVFANEEDDGLVYTDADTDADFCLIAKGDSMKDARIQNGDIVFVKKADIVNNIAKETGVEKVLVQQIVEAFMENVKGSLIEKEPVYLRGFGSFIIKERAQKVARNISKGTTITIPAHSIPAFKPAKSFASKVK